MDDNVEITSSRLRMNREQIWRSSSFVRVNLGKQSSVLFLSICDIS